MAMIAVDPTSIKHGDRLAIELKNGLRIAGKADGRIKTGRGISWTLGIYRVTGGWTTVDGADIRTMLAL